MCALTTLDPEKVLLLDELVLLKEQGLNNKTTAEMMGEQRYRESRKVLGHYRTAYTRVEQNMKLEAIDRREQKTNLRTSY